MGKLTQKQRLVLSGYTGILCCNSFNDFQKDVEDRLGRPVFTHEFGNEEFSIKLKEVYKDDFLEMLKY